MSVCLWPILGVSPKHLPNNLPTKVSVQDPDWSEGDTFCLNSLLKILWHILYANILPPYSGRCFGALQRIHPRLRWTILVLVGGEPPGSHVRPFGAIPPLSSWTTLTVLPASYAGSRWQAERGGNFAAWHARSHHWNRPGPAAPGPSSRSGTQPQPTRTQPQTPKSNSLFIQNQCRLALWVVRCLSSISAAPSSRHSGGSRWCSAVQRWSPWFRRLRSPHPRSRCAVCHPPSGTEAAHLAGLADGSRSHGRSISHCRWAPQQPAMLSMLHLQMWPAVVRPNSPRLLSSPAQKLLHAGAGHVWLDCAWLSIVLVAPLYSVTGHCWLQTLLELLSRWLSCRQERRAGIW